MLKQLYLIIILTFCAVFAQAEEVKGHVFDDNNQPIIGANVYWEGTQQGTTTDVDGAFELKTRKSTNKLVVSYIGYETFVMPVTKSTSRSKPRPKPLWGTVPKRRVSRYHHMSFIGMLSCSMRCWSLS